MTPTPAPTVPTPPTSPARRRVTLRAARAASLAAALCGLCAATAAASPTAPTVAFTAGTAAPLWTTGAPVITATATPGDPGDPVAFVGCQVDGGAVTTRSGAHQSVWVTGGQGVHTVSCSATSAGGAQSQPVSEEIQIDNQTPSLTLSGAAPSRAWDTGAQTVTATASEDQQLGGIASVTCAADSHTVSTPGDTASITVDGDGPHLVRCWALTNAGVDSAIESETVQVDSTLPTLTYSDGPDQARWYPTSQSVQVRATTPSGLADVREIDCALDGANTTYANTAGGDNETITIPISAPGGHLDCVAVDTASNATAPARYVFHIDAVAPTGYFVPDTANPTDVQASFADAQSGLNTAALRLQQPGGRWMTLPTKFDRRTGQATAQIPESMMTAGTSLLSAVVTDNAGNSTTVTTDAAGNPALVTLPVHARATLDEQLARVPRAHSARKQRWPKASGWGSPKRPPLPRPIAPGFVARLHGLRLSYGQRARVTGYLRTAAGQPLQGYVLSVVQAVYGQHKSEVIGQVTTNRDGEYSYLIPYGPARTIAIQWLGNLVLAPKTITHQVRSVDAATLNIRTSIEHRSLTLSGRILGGYLPTRGLQVNFWWRVGCCDRWHFLTKTHADADGHYVEVKSLPARLGHLPIEIRSSVPGKGLWPWLRAFSPALLVRF